MIGFRRDPPSRQLDVLFAGSRPACGWIPERPLYDLCARQLQPLVFGRRLLRTAGRRLQCCLRSTGLHHDLCFGGLSPNCSFLEGAGARLLSIAFEVRSLAVYVSHCCLRMCLASAASVRTNFASLPAALPARLLSSAWRWLLLTRGRLLSALGSGECAQPLVSCADAGAWHLVLVAEFV